MRTAPVLPRSIFRIFSCLGGFSLLTVVGFPSFVKASDKHLIRVLVLESPAIRIRADQKKIFVRGDGIDKRIVRGLNLRLINGQIKVKFDGDVPRWNSLGSDSSLIASTNEARGIWLGKRRYRGELRIKLKGRNLQVVNHIGIEEYLYSVVGSEMPKSWPLEALKAQAVAARTYALKKISKHNDFDIKSTESSQVYLGIESETVTTKNAVNKTRGLIMTYEGKPIEAVFHSSSGGRTEASVNVWKKHLPYLISVKDFDHQSPNYRWNVSFNKDQLLSVFPEVGNFKNIRLLNVSPTKRILIAKVQGDDGDLLLNGRELRTRLGLKSTLVSFEKNNRDVINNKIVKKSTLSSVDKQQYAHIPFNSRAKSHSYREEDRKPVGLDLEFPPVQSPPPAPFALPPSPLGNGFVLLASGSGSGHGVGMSQWGARGFADSGASFRRILYHYYKNIKIRHY